MFWLPGFNTGLYSFLLNWKSTYQYTFMQELAPSPSLSLSLFLSLSLDRQNSRWCSFVFKVHSWPRFCHIFGIILVHSLVNAALTGVVPINFLSPSTVEQMSFKITCCCLDLFAKLHITKSLEDSFSNSWTFPCYFFVKVFLKVQDNSFVFIEMF